MDRGLVHLYCGEGKGKTTAALGLCVRAAGAGRKVVFVQFMKGRATSELNVLRRIPEITVLRNEEDLGFTVGMSGEDKEKLTRMHNRNLDRLRVLVEEGSCDVLVLDEATYPYSGGYLDRDKLEGLILNRPEHMEVVVTGRGPAEFFLAHADYITEMKCLRHPYERGIGAREGIEF